MPVPMLDITGENGAIRNEVRGAIDRIIDRGQFILGEPVERFEADLAAYCGVEHAIGVSSGTDALLAALMAREIGPGDEVIVPSFTFFATAGAVHRLGARCVFADIDPATFNLAPEAVEAAVTEKTRAIVPVHLFGQCVEMDAIMALAERHGLFVLEDAAQAIGGRDRGRPAGSISHAGALSFYPTKNLGGFGDAGAVLTNNADLAERVTRIRLHGQTDAYRHQFVGGNFRIDSLQAAALHIKLQHLDDYAAARRSAAIRYDTLLEGLPVTRPTAVPGRHHVFNQYTIRCTQRDALCDHLQTNGIGHKVYYPLPLHLQPCFADLGYREGDLPESERASREVVSLPMHPRLRSDEQEEVARVIRGFYHGG